MSCFVDHKYWQPNPSLTVHYPSGWSTLENDGTHQWKYFTHLAHHDATGKVVTHKPWAFVLRNMSETAEIRLDDFSGGGTLRLRSPGADSFVELSAKQAKELSASVSEKFASHFSEPVSQLLISPDTSVPKFCLMQVFTSPKFEYDRRVSDEKEQEQEQEQNTAAFALREIAAARRRRHLQNPSDSRGILEKGK